MNRGDLVGGRWPRWGDELPNAVPEDDRRAVTELADDLGYVVAEVAEADAGHGAGDPAMRGVAAQDP